MSREASPSGAITSPLLAYGGYVAVPAVLLRYQARLGLSHGEVVYVLHVLAAAAEEAVPPLSVADVATAAGVHVTRARSWKASLIGKGYLAVRTGFGPNGAKRADRHDLSGLLNALESLVVEEETRRQLATLHRDLPAARFQAQTQSVPQLMADRRLVRRTNPTASENARPRSSENARTIRRLPAAERREQR